MLFTPASGPRCQSPRPMKVAVIAGVLGSWLANPAATEGQQFVEDSAARLPAASPLEYSEQVDIADIDGDGDLDVLFANGRGFSGPQLEEPNRLYVNDGAGFFADETDDRMAGVTGHTRDVEFGDVDDDGDLDCLIVNAFATQSRLLINNGAGFFADQTDTRLPEDNLGGSDADFGDVDNDCDLDIILTNSGSSPFGSGVDRLYINNGSGVFSDESATRLPGTSVSQSIDCDFFDMDGDLDLDLIMTHRDPASQLWENDGTGHFTDVTAGNLPPDGSGTYSFDAGDIDGDGDLDLLAVRGSTEKVYANDGGGSFTDVTPTALPNNPFQDDNDGDFLDIDNDGDLDIAIARLGSGGERLYLNNGGGVFTLTPGLISVLSDSTLDIEFGDLNGDGRLDIVTAQGESGSFRNRVYINNGPVDDRPPTFHGMTQLANTADPTGPYAVRASIRDGMTSDNNFFDRGVELYYRVGLGQPNARPMSFAGGDHYCGAIPGLAAGSVVVYWVSATDWSANTSVSSSSVFVVTGGVLGDFDGDSDVDLFDAERFQICFSGVNGGIATGCATFDFDGDGDVDLADYRLFQLALTGGP